MQAAHVEASIGFYPHRKGPCLPRGTDTPSVPAHSREELTQEVLSRFSPEDGKGFGRWKEDKGDRSQVTAAVFLSFPLVQSRSSRAAWLPGRTTHPAAGLGEEQGRRDPSVATYPGACALGPQLGSVGQTGLQLQQEGLQTP